MKLPAIAGMEEFRGRSFHSARWDYGYTGGAPDDPHLDQLGDKVVGIIGTGASAIQAVPALAESAKHLYVFQRTPSAIGVRGNRPTPDDFTDGLEPGWQRQRMENFSAVMTGVPVEHDLTDDGWTHHMARVTNPEIPEGMSLDEIMLMAEEFDYSRDGGAPLTGESRSSATRACREPQAVLPLPVQTTRASTTSTCRRSTATT